MSDFVIRNLNDLDDVAAGAGADIEARFARDAIESEHLGVSLFRYRAGARTPFGHHHREQEEAYVVVAGSGRVKLGDEIHDLRQWDIVRVAPAVLRSFEGGPDGLELIAIGNDRPEGGDGQRVPGHWTD